MATGYTPKSPERETRGTSIKQEKSQLPDDDEEDVLISKCPIGITDDSVRTFIFKNQGFTLGYVLKDQILGYDGVEFCGCSIPHPGEFVMHLRVQTKRGSGLSASDMLKRALEDIVQMCDHVEHLYKQELEKKEYTTS